TVQEVFARAFSPAARLAYDGLRPYRNYLFTIARNLVIDATRARVHELVVDDEAPDDPTGTAEDEVLARQIESHCRAFVAGLTPAERALFEARFRQGRSIEEAARELSITQHQVKRTERVLKKRFFVEMKRHGYFEGYAVSAAGLERVALLLVL